MAKTETETIHRAKRVAEMDSGGAGLPAGTSECTGVAYSRRSEFSGGAEKALFGGSRALTPEQGKLRYHAVLVGTRDFQRYRF